MNIKAGDIDGYGDTWQRGRVRKAARGNEHDRGSERGMWDTEGGFQHRVVVRFGDVDGLEAMERAGGRNGRRESWS